MSWGYVASKEQNRKISSLVGYKRVMLRTDFPVPALHRSAAPAAAPRPHGHGQRYGGRGVAREALPAARRRVGRLPDEGVVRAGDGVELPPRRRQPLPRRVSGRAQRPSGGVRPLGAATGLGGGSGGGGVEESGSRSEDTEWRLASDARLFLAGSGGGDRNCEKKGRRN